MEREGQLAGQTLVVIGGSSGIGLAAARQARGEGAHVIVTARNPERVHRVGVELGASIAAFDATDPDRLARFFDAMPTPIEHVLVTVPVPSSSSPGGDAGDALGANNVDAHLSLPLLVARNAARWLQPAGLLLFIGCIRGGDPSAPSGGSALSGSAGSLMAAVRGMTEQLAVELAPVRVNLIMAGFVDTPLSAAILGEQLDARREELRSRLPIRRIVGPDDVAALAVHLMVNTAVTGTVYEIDGGQKLIEGA
jgi:NAD(P)-dependent dehydrogenase (short-subunit alcohol dehydrogenase family)